MVFKLERDIQIGLGIEEWRWVGIQRKCISEEENCMRKSQCQGSWRIKNYDQYGFIRIKKRMER